MDEKTDKEILIGTYIGLPNSTFCGTINGIVLWITVVERSKNLLEYYTTDNELLSAID